MLALLLSMIFFLLTPNEAVKWRLFAGRPDCIYESLPERQWDMLMDSLERQKGSRWVQKSDLKKKTKKNGELHELPLLMLDAGQTQTPSRLPQSSRSVRTFVASDFWISLCVHLGGTCCACVSGWVPHHG